MRRKRSDRIRQDRSTLDNCISTLFRKKKLSLIVLINLLMIYVFSLTTLNALTSPTNAAFNDIEHVNASIHVKWDVPEDQLWGKSSLSFLEGENEYGGNCNRIFATIKNGNDSGVMENHVNYEVYWVSSGPIRNGDVIIGTKVFEGTIPNLLGPGEQVELTYNPQTNSHGASGKYMFRGFQETVKPGQIDYWIGDIELTCPETGTGKSNKTESSSEQENTQSNSDDQQNEEGNGTEETTEGEQEQTVTEVEKSAEVETTPVTPEEQKESNTGEESVENTDSGKSKSNDGGESSESQKVD